MPPFPPLYEAFLRAAEADSGLRKESFLEQARHHIAEGKLRASGRQFSVTQTKRGWLTGAEIAPRENKTESPDRIEIPPLAMADHRLIFVDGPKVDCQVVLDGPFDYWRTKMTARFYSGCMSGWKDVRVVAGDVEQLWPCAATSPGVIVASSRGAYDSGERARSSLAKCFPEGRPSEAEVPNSELVRRVQAKHGELFSGASAPTRKTILIHAGRKNRN